MHMESAFDMLVDDVNGYQLKQIREELFSMKMDIKHCMDTGMTAEEMARARAVLEGVETADTVVARIHQMLHQ